MTTAAEYVRQQWVATRERYSETCTFHARRIAELLLAEGRAPWIGRIRETIVRGDTVFHGALIPRRYLGRGSLAWTTHYVACSGCDVYDPLAGEPVDVSEYAAEVFGRMLSIEVHLDVEATERLLKSGLPTEKIEGELIISSLRNEARDDAKAPHPASGHLLPDRRGERSREGPRSGGEGLVLSVEDDFITRSEET